MGVRSSIRNNNTTKKHNKAKIRLRYVKVARDGERIEFELVVDLENGVCTMMEALPVGVKIKWKLNPILMAGLRDE